MNRKAVGAILLGLDFGSALAAGVVAAVLLNINMWLGIAFLVVVISAGVWYIMSGRAERLAGRVANWLLSK